MHSNSKRLMLRELKVEDFKSFLSVVCNEETMNYALIDKFDYKQDAKNYFNTLLTATLQDKTQRYYPLGAFLLSDNSFIGFGLIEILKRSSSTGRGEIGYFLLPEFWGQGYASEIANKLIEICFKNLNLHRVEARCNFNNFNSEKVMIKVGMMKEGELRKARFKHKVWDDEKCYGILYEEWCNRCTTLQKLNI